MQKDAIEHVVRMEILSEIITVESIAEKYGIKPDDVICFLRNNIRKLQKEGKATKEQIALLDYI